MKFLKGVCLSELFILWVEFFYKFGVNDSPKPFFIAIPFYFIYLSFLHALFRTIDKHHRFWLFAILIGGTTGLMLEWFLVGNSPWNNPKALQVGQFLFHGVYPILGYLLVHGSVPRALRHRLTWYLVIATGFTSVGFLFSNLNLHKLWLLGLPLLGYVGLYYFIYQLKDSLSSNSLQLATSSL